MNNILDNYLCSVCNGALVKYWNGQEWVIGCGRDHSHRGHRKTDYKMEHLLSMRKTAIERGMPTVEIDAMIQEYQINKQEGNDMVTQEKTLQRYQGCTNLTEKDATHILETCWPNAPKHEVVKAALLCQSYGLNPLMKHVFLIPFNTKGGAEWVTVMGIKATRLLASRRKSFTYADGPRVMTEEEQKAIFGKVDNSRIWAICKVGDLAGNQAPGYGFWPATSNPYGMDKGNTPENMAFIRAERNALDRLLPGEMPDVEVVDERYPSFNGQEQVIESTAKEIPEVFKPKDNGADGERASLEQELMGILQNKPPEGFGWLEPTALKYLGILSIDALPTVPIDTLKLMLAKAKAMRADQRVGQSGRLL